MSDNDVEILFVEDNPQDVKIALRVFQTHHLANRIQVVRDGAQALEYLFCSGRYAQRQIGKNPKFILLDLKLPLVDGIEVLRQIRGDPRTHAIPVVVMTASREEKEVVERHQLGVISYIVKPI